MRALVTGAGGMIGGHLVRRLLEDGHDVRAVDIKKTDQWWQLHDQADNQDGIDLSGSRSCEWACLGVDEVYQLAADMGGIGFIEGHKAECMLSVLTSTQMLLAARNAGVRQFFYASSACVYPQRLQRTPYGDSLCLREEDAYPADPEDGYGWEKLFAERMCRHFTEDFGLETRVARFHNVYGPHGTWTGGREKAPAAICRKVAEAVLSGDHSIEIWGDGGQTRSFMHVDDCTEGIVRLTASDVSEPLNLGSSELVTIDQLVTIVEGIAGVTLERRYDRKAPQGVRGRNSDNTRIRAELGWEPSTSLLAGLEPTYRWVHDRVAGV